MSLTKDDLKSISNLMDDKIGHLARITAKGFNEVNGKFNEVNDKFEKIEGKILESEERTSGIIKSEVRSLENTVNSNHGAMISEFIKIHGRIDGVEKKVDTINQRTLKDDNVIFTDLHNIKRDMIIHSGYFKKLGVKVTTEKGVK